MSFIKKFTQGLKTQRKSLSENDFYHIETEKDKLVAPTPVIENVPIQQNLPYPNPQPTNTQTVPTYKANKVTCPSCGLSLFNQDEAKIKSHIDACSSSDNKPPPNKPPVVAPIVPNSNNVTNKYFAPTVHNPSNTYPGTVPVTYNMPPPYNPSYAPPSSNYPPYPPPQQQPTHTYVQPQVIAYYPPPPVQQYPPPPSNTYYPPPSKAYNPPSNAYNPPPPPPPQKTANFVPAKPPARFVQPYVGPRSNPQPKSNRSDFYDSPFGITCPYPGCSRKMEAHEFLQHVNNLHSGFSQAYACPICPLLGYGSYQINKNTNLLQHVTNQHSDLQPISVPNDFQDFPDDFPDDDDFQYDPSQFEDQAVIDPEALKSTIGSHYIEETVKEYKSGTECSICYDEFEVGNVLARMDCFCVYHKKCIDSWLQKHKKCPLHNSDS